MNIDLVVPWVDGSDIEHIKQKNKYRQLLAGQITDNADSDCRFRDNGELKYLLRSIEQNAKFIRYIFLVTNGQKPKWLNENNPKIKIVNHTQIMPKNALPTFNAYAIETCIANIPNLSDTFLYTNDDFIIAKPISKNFFFNKKGYPISRLRTAFYPKESMEHFDLYDRIIVFTSELFFKKFNKYFYLTEHHNIDAFYKPDVLNCIKEFKGDFDRTTQCKFRQEKNVSKLIWSLYSFYKGHSTIKGLCFLRFIIFLVSIKKLIKHLFSKLKSSNKNENNKSHSVFTSNKDFQSQSKTKKLLYEIIENKLILKSSVVPMYHFNKNHVKDFTLFCVNDDILATDEDRKEYTDFLNTLFPNKSSFEI